MNIGTIEVEGTGLTNGHPPVIISGKIKAGTVCAMNGLLSLDKTTGEFEAYTVAAETGAAKVLLHGTFNGDTAVKADGAALSAAELAAVQSNSHIFFV